MAKMSTKALLRGRAKRNIGDQLLQAVGEMKAGKAGNVHRVAMSAVTPARTSAGLHDAVAAATRWPIGALGSDQNAPETPEDTATSLPDHDGSLCPKRMLFSRRPFQSSRVSNSCFEVSPLTIAMLAIIRRMSSRANLVTVHTSAARASMPHSGPYSFSVDAGARWEDVFFADALPCTKRVALRTSLVMAANPGGLFSILSCLARLGLGGTQGRGDQRLSWMHEVDFARAIDLLLAPPEVAHETKGIVNLVAPEAPTNREFMRTLRGAWHVTIGMPAPEFVLRPALWVIRSEPELILHYFRLMLLYIHPK